MPRKYDRDNKGAPSSRTPAPTVQERAHRRPADLGPGLPVLRREAVAIIPSPESFSRKNPLICLDFALIFL
jgi:hypothetical protein